MMIWRNVRNVGNRVLTADPRGAQHATGTLQRANEGLARSKRTLTAIGRRALGNKLIMWAMIFLLSAAVLLLFYVELFGIKGSSKNATASASG